MSLEFTLTHNFYIWARSSLFSGNQTNSSASSGDTSSGDSVKIYYVGTPKTLDGTNPQKNYFNRFFKSSSSGDWDITNNDNYLGQTTLCTFSNTNDIGDAQSNTFITVGSDNTETDYEQYCLNNDTTSNFSIVLGMNQVYNQETNLGSLIISVGLTNTTTENQVVGEIGLNKCLATTEGKNRRQTDTTYNFYPKFLLGRAVLDNPITIKPNQQIQLQLSISL